MSHQATTWVMEFSESRLADRLVLGAIAHRVSNDNGEAFPSVGTIAREARLSESSVHASLRRLKRMGELEIDMGGSQYGTNVYRMPKFLSWFLTLHALQGVQSLHPRKRKVRTGGVQITLEMTPDSAPEPSRTIIESSEIQNPAASPLGDPRHRTFVEFATKTYSVRFGQAPTWSKRDFKFLSDLLRLAPAATVNDLQRRFTFYINSTEHFIAKNGHALWLFCRKYDALREGPIFQEGASNGKSKLAGNDLDAENRAVATTAGRGPR